MSEIQIIDFLKQIKNVEIDNNANCIFIMKQNQLIIELLDKLLKKME
jgi:hypothetical protein